TAGDPRCRVGRHTRAVARSPRLQAPRRPRSAQRSGSTSASWPSLSPYEAERWPGAPGSGERSPTTRYQPADPAHVGRGPPSVTRSAVSQRSLARGREPSGEVAEGRDRVAGVGQTEVDHPPVVGGSAVLLEFEGVEHPVTHTLALVVLEGVRLDHLAADLH